MIYAYSGVKTGEPVEGRIVATDETWARRELQRREIQIEGDLVEYDVPPAKSAQCVQFLGDLSVLLESNIKVDDALEILMEMYPFASGILRNLQAGQSLEESVRNVGGFDSLSVFVLGVGEKSGNLGASLSVLHAGLLRAATLRKEVVEMLMYPLVFCTVFFGVMGAFVYYLAPMLTKMMDDLSRSRAVSMPAATKAIFAVAEFIRMNPFPTYGGLLLVLFGLEMSRRSGLLGAGLSRLPLFRKFFDYQMLAQVFGVLFIMLKAQIRLQTALEMVSLSAGARASARFEPVLAALRAGSSITESFRKTAFEMDVYRFVELGEKAQRLDDMMQNLEKRYTEKLGRLMKVIKTAIEYGGLGMMACMVGALAMLVYAPILRLIGTMH